MLTDDRGALVRTAELPSSIADRRIVVEMSLFDRQVLAAIDGQILFDAWPVESRGKPSKLTGRPVKFGAVGLSAAIDSLALYRDVYYTRKAGKATTKLAADHYYLLGDNSPASQDARLWEREKYVDRSLLLGKALIIFWPHSFNRIPGTSIPFPFFPNFARMGLIR